MLMPLTYSIAYGLIGGMMSWFSMQLVFWTLALFGVKRVKAPAEQRSFGIHNMKTIVKEEDQLEALPESLHPVEETEVIEKEDIEVSIPEEPPSVSDIF